MIRELRRALTLACTLGLALGCRLPNEDHCLHQAADANQWCADRDSEYPFCSPCEAERRGCVDTEPTPETCPSYSAPALDTGTETGADTGDTGSGAP